MRNDKWKILLLIVLFGSILGLAMLGVNAKRVEIKKEYPTFVKIQGRQLVADYDQDGVYEPYLIKGVGYSPIPIDRHPSDWGWDTPVRETRINNIYDDEAILLRDFKLLYDMHANTIRIWKGNNTMDGNGRFPNHITEKTLDMAEEYGLKVIAGFWIDTKQPKCKNDEKIYDFPNFTAKVVREKYKKEFADFVNTFKDHPAILFWAIGNENNYQINPYDNEQISAWYSLVNEMAQVAHETEGARYHPVAVVNGEIGDIGRLFYGTNDNQMQHLDIWGVNVYRGESFGALFVDYIQKSGKPLWISEYGVDAWYAYDYNDSAVGHEDQDRQAEWVGALWDEVAKNNAVTVGATVMEYSDEWWKPNEWIDKGLHNRKQDYFGDGPTDTDCDGKIDWYPPAPDGFFHQEWFGIVAISDDGTDLNEVIPRKAYYTLQERFK